MWNRIKSALSAENGAAFFENQMKNSSVPQLRGVLVEARPACHPRELLVAVPSQDAPAPTQAEIRLQLDKPLGGRPAAGGELEWEGVATEFTSQPFLLTMDAEAAKVTGLKMEPCAPAVRKK